MLIQDIMTKNAVCCSERQTLNEAAQQMWENDIGAVPVVDDNGIATGIITDRDICMAGYTQGRLLNQIPLQAAMSQQLFTLTPESDVKLAQQLMRDKQIRRIPIVDEAGKPVGIVSLNDVAQRLGSGRGDVPARDVAETLRQVCRPRELTAPQLAATG